MGAQYFFFHVRILGRGSERRDDTQQQVMKISTIRRRTSRECQQIRSPTRYDPTPNTYLILVADEDELLATSNDRDQGGDLGGLSSLVDHHSGEPDRAEPAVTTKKTNNRNQKRQHKEMRRKLHLKLELKLTLKWKWKLKLKLKVVFGTLERQGHGWRAPWRGG